MNCLIVDDHKIYRELIKRMLKFDPSLVLVGEYDNAMEAHQKILSEQVDLIFLDIKMPGMSGIELAKILSNKRPLIIFTTAETSYAVEAFDLNVVDFLVKPLITSRLLQAVEKAKQVNSIQNISLDKTTDEFAFIRDSNTIRRISIKDILFLEADADYVKIFLDNQIYTIHSSLKDIEQKLPTDLFFKVHRSFIVNVGKIDTIEGKTLVIGHHFVPVSDTYKTDLMKRIHFL